MSRLGLRFSLILLSAMLFLIPIDVRAQVNESTDDPLAMPAEPMQVDTRVDDRQDAEIRPANDLPIDRETDHDLQKIENVKRQSRFRGQVAVEEKQMKSKIKNLEKELQAAKAKADRARKDAATQKKRLEMAKNDNKKMRSKIAQLEKHPKAVNGKKKKVADSGKKKKNSGSKDKKVAKDKARKKDSQRKIASVPAGKN